MLKRVEVVKGTRVVYAVVATVVYVVFSLAGQSVTDFGHAVTVKVSVSKTVDVDKNVLDIDAPVAEEFVYRAPL